MQLAVRVFMVGEAVSLYVGHKPVLASHILPDAIERAYPQVVIVVTHNGPDGYGAQSLASREGNSAAFLPLIDIKSIVGTDDDVAIGFLADALNHLVSKYLVPSQGIEMVVGSVETAESVGSSNPQNALTVTHERMHPVVAYMSVFGSHHVVGEVARRLRLGVVDEEALAVDGNKETAPRVTGHGMNAITLISHLRCKRFTFRVETIQHRACGQPHTTLQVTHDTIGRLRCLEMLDHIALTVKAVEAVIAGQSPHDALTVVSNALYGIATDVALLRQAPRLERPVLRINLKETLGIASQSDIVITIGEDSAD